ncbi:merozoite organizing protein, putative [Plasmodium ovale]|uniref:Merozoite organizing protein n=2 Tax=Plasmodium ovale TaxID=36330 RepID=A0A1A8W0E4_PLAOA|nr:conserved Plasmodium protein, unknown function [Plasmodium ovale curtisi]SBS91027.1 conserved Plasmodium protein, unknown function [Plasmodium ovale curtisi]SCQ16158.1 merozoite organizing protein, putative [Plasmodium ovale]
MLKSYKLKRTNEKNEEEKAKGGNDNISNLVNLHIRNENIHIKNIVRTIHYVYTNRYDGETGFSYIKDILKNIIKGNVYDIAYKRYVNEYCIYELCSRVILNMVKSNMKDNNFYKIMEFLFDILYYCDILLSNNTKKKKMKHSNDIENGNTYEYELITKLWNRLLDNMFIKDKKQRANLCKVVKALVKKACALQIDVSNQLCKKHVNIFLSLLNDKDHNIRVLCLNILEPFQDFNTRTSYFKCLDDSHNVVRISAVKNVSINIEDCSKGGNAYDHLTVLKHFLVRINDTNHNVRISVYEKLKNYYFYIPSDMKFELLLCGLNDKDKSVRESCYNMIIHWVQLFDDKIENLLLHLINSDIDNDMVVEQICKIHLNNIRRGVVSSVSVELEDPNGFNGGSGVGYGDNCGRDTGGSQYNEEWFNRCAGNLFFLNTAELYILRVYVQHFADDQEKEKIDALQVINVIYYYLYLSKFNERLYYNRKNYINCIDNNESDQVENQYLFCSCGKSNIDLKVLEENRKKKFMECSIFDDDYCDKCMYYRMMKKDNSKGSECEVGREESGVDVSPSESHRSDDHNNSETVENVLINEDNINENYNYICNIKNLLLICRYLDIIEIYQLEKILQCCSTVLLMGPLREVIIKCMLNNTGVNYYKLQKGHITCAYWLSNSYIYACLELLRHMIYMKNKNCDVNDVEINLTSQILTIISEIKEPFENADNENLFLDNTMKLVEGNKDGEGEHGEGTPINRISPVKKNDKEKIPLKKNPLSALFSSIMNVENDSIFDIIRKKNLNTLSIEHLLILCRKMQHKLDVTEAKIKDLTEMERERANGVEGADEEGRTRGTCHRDQADERTQGNENPTTGAASTFHEQILLHTQVFLKQITMLSLLRLELKRRWLRVLFILECFLCKSKSHCSFDSALREFPNELLLPALNFCCSVMPEWDDKEIEDQFYDIIVSKCLGNWCMFISNDDELKKQIYAYKTAIVDTCEVLNSCLLNIEQTHASVYPDIYRKANIDLANHSDKLPGGKNTVQEEGNDYDDERTERDGRDGRNYRQGDENAKRTDLEGETGTSYIFFEYNPPNEYLLSYFATNQNAWYEYKELLEKLEINSLRCEIYICVLGDLLMTHPNLSNDELIVEAVENLWNYLNGNINTSKYIQSVCLRVCCKLLLTEYIGSYVCKLTNDELYVLVKKSCIKLRSLFEMCFLMSPSTYNCVQDFKKISTYNITNINSHDKIFLFSTFSMYPSMSETNLLVFHYTLEEIILKTCEGVIKHKLKTVNFTNILTFMIFTILHKSNMPFLVTNFAKYIKWILLIIIEKGLDITNRSNIIELVHKIIHIYLFHDLNDLKNINVTRSYQAKEAKKRGRKKKMSSTDLEKANPTEPSNGSASLEGNIDNTASHAISQEVSHSASHTDGSPPEDDGGGKRGSIFLQSVKVDVNTALKELKTFYVLINFCMHSSDIVKSRNEIRYCEIVKESIEKKIEEVKSYFVKNNLVVLDEENEGERCKDISDCTDRGERADNLLNIRQLESLREETIYDEIIDDYASYIGSLSSRGFSYVVLPRGLDCANEEHMTRKEILSQINCDNNINAQNNSPKGSLNNVNMKMTRGSLNSVNRRMTRQYVQEVSNGDESVERKRNQDEYADLCEDMVETSPKGHITGDERSAKNPNEELLKYSPTVNGAENGNHGNNFATKKGSNETFLMHHERDGSTLVGGDSKEYIKSDARGGNGTEMIGEGKHLEGQGSATPDHVKRKLAELNLSSSEDSVQNGGSSREDDYASVKNYASLNEDNASCTSFSSNDSTAMTFRRLNKLKRTSYTSVVSK